MVFRIEYFSKNVLIGAISCAKPLIDARENAKRGIKLHKAEFAKVLDVDRGNTLVEMVKPDA
jgi:hypothetical protein